VHLVQQQEGYLACKYKPVAVKPKDLIWELLEQHFSMPNAIPITQPSSKALKE